MTIYLIVIDSADCREIDGAYATLALAETAILRTRDRLVRDWRDRIADGSPADLYGPMIDNLADADYRKWGDSVHEVPHVYPMELVTE